MPNIGDDTGAFVQIGGPVNSDATHVVESFESVGEQLSFVLGDGIEPNLVEEVRGRPEGDGDTAAHNAIAAEEAIENLGIRFVKPNLNENWDYNTPTKTIALMGKGMGWVEHFNYDGFSLAKWDRQQQIQRENVMIRGFITKFYYPESIKSKSEDPLAGPKRLYIPRVLLMEELWTHIRSTGMIPFEIRVCAYSKNSRYTYDLDLVNNTMLKDFRGGQAPLRNRAERTAVDYLNFDIIFAATDMKDIVKKAFINLFEMEKATAFDISHSMGITDNMAMNALNSIVYRGLAEKVGTPPREIYSIDPDALAQQAKKFE